MVTPIISLLAINCKNVLALIILEMQHIRKARPSQSNGRFLSFCNSKNNNIDD